MERGFPVDSVKIESAPSLEPDNVMVVSTLQYVQERHMVLLKLASVDHLHTEAKLLNVSEHLHMLTAKYLASALRESHASFDVVTNLDGPRNLKETLQSAFYGEVAPYLVDGVIPPAHYKNTKAKIHANFVQRSIAARNTNPVLGRKPPPIHQSEKRLPRAYRSAMAQLRSGFSSSLNSYLVRVGRSDTSTCPRCGIDEQSPAHLYDCPQDRTHLDLKTELHFLLLRVLL